MSDSVNLKPHDISVAIKILLVKEKNWRQVDISNELAISQSEIAKSIKRLKFAGIALEKK